MATVITLGQTYTLKDVQEKDANTIQHCVTIEHPADEMTIDEVIECLIASVFEGYGYCGVRRRLGCE